MHRAGAEAILEARFANYFEVGYTALEFVVQFGQAYKDESPPAIHTRVVTDPVYVKELLHLLAESIHSYEREHGPIGEPESGRR